MVLRYPRKIRYLAVFVLAFVCLNAAGAVCVAYCRGFTTVGEVAHHQSPEKSLSKHCDRSPGKGKHQNGRAISVGRNADVCPMTVSFLAASVEKKSFVIVEPVLAAVIETPRSPVAISIESSDLSRTEYRGPPPLDRRIERIKHGLLLI